MKCNLTVDDKIKFAEEAQRYTVQACDNRYAVCTKPMNAHKTVLYTILDFEEGLRNKDNLVLGVYDYKTRKGCEEALSALSEGTIGLSHRGRLGIAIDLIKSEIKGRP